MYTHAPRPCFVMAESSAWNAHSPDLHMPCFLIIFRCLLKYHNLIECFLISLKKNSNSSPPTILIILPCFIFLHGTDHQILYHVLLFYLFTVYLST